MTKVIRGIGKVISAPIHAVGSVASKIPLVGNLVGKPLEHIAGGLAGREPLLGGLAKGLVPIGLGLGSFGLGPLGGIMSKIGGGAAGKSLASKVFAGAGPLTKGGIGTQILAGIKKNPYQALQTGIAGLNAVEGAKAQTQATNLRNTAVNTPEVPFNPYTNPYRKPGAATNAASAALGY